MSTTASYKKMITKGYASAIDNTPIENDTIRMTIDTFQLFADLNDERIEITDFIKGMTEEQIRSIYAPLPKFYFASDTHKLLVYDSNVDEWVVCAERNKDFIAKALEADHATSADSATSAITATNASTAEYASFAENASTAQYATSAENANNATNANHATSANSATNASTADYAVNAKNASTANYANNANVAISATNASTADYATNADKANTATNASTADYATNADKANTATNASTAEYASNADKANSATNAENANTAGHATSAGTATNASTAEYALNATNASTANYASTANVANTATNASTAEFSTNADKANTATNASTADYATSANSADTANSATNASTADYSSYSNKALQDANGEQINTHYAPLQSPMFTGIPTVPTPATNSNDSQIANTEFVKRAIIESLESGTGSDITLTKTIVDNFESLPEVGDSNTIYLVPNSNGEDGNYYDEYIWIDDSYEIIGSTKINLSGYYNSIEVTGTGNAITGVSETENGLQFFKNASFLTEHPSVSKTSSEATEAPSGGSMIKMVDSIAVDAYGHLVNYRLKTVTLPDSVSNAGTATYANNAGTAVNASTSTYATNAGTATYGTNAGTAVYANNAGSATNATNASTATYATNAKTATNAGTATYATNAGNATNASTATYATNAGTATYGTNAGTATYANNAGTATRATNDGAGNNINTTYIKNVTVNGKTVTFEKGNGSTFSIDTQDTNTTYSNYVGATTAAAGKAGLVPSASTAARTQFLRGDGAWATPTNTTYNVVSTTADGLCPKRNGSTYSFLRGDGNWTSMNVSPAGESDLDFGDLDE